MINPVTYPFPVKHVNIHDNIDIAYVDTGKGDQTILFIHGLANYIPVWKYQLKELSKDFRCIAIDLPGNGLSSRGDYPYTMFFYAECIKRFCDALNLDKPILTGHSMGGQISIVYSLRYPHLVEKMVLIAPAGFEYYSAADKMLMQGLHNLSDLFFSDESHLETVIKKSFYNENNESNVIIGELKKLMKTRDIKEWRNMTVKSIDGMLNEQVSQFLPEITIPVLILFGTKDKLIPNPIIRPMDSTESIAKHGAAMIPDSKLKMIENGGHFLQIEKCREVNEAIMEFVS